MMDVVGDIFNQILAGFKTDTLKSYIGRDLDLVELLTSAEQLKPFVDAIRKEAPKHKGLVRRNIDSYGYAEIMGFLCEKRPDMYDMIVLHPNGMRWVRKQERGFKRFLKSVCGLE